MSINERNKIHLANVFLAVANTLNFSKASEILGVSKSNVTRQINLLEEMLGARLFNRTTRHVVLTDEGDQFLESCIVTRQLLDSIFHEAQANDEPMQGYIWCELPSALSSNPILTKRMELERMLPGIELRISCVNKRSGALPAEVDCAIRYGRSQDLGFYCLKLGDQNSVQYVLCAQESLLDKFGTPETPAELSDFPMLDYFYQWESPDSEWHFYRDGINSSIAVQPLAEFDDFSLLLSAGINGGGIFPVPYELCRDYIKSGKLIHVLPEWKMSPGWCLYLCIKRERCNTKKMRIFSEWIKNSF
ncbi:LysR family transcriptional regulator [Laribacter hongkongensis]|uniref:LysR family transcriptional regulator n=1 Tax=Laribacter hongkongensis TaxID=168471 RepID=UPI001EFED37C|nr:LysR family transcriptional regulator [Laribacter hongkongensis]MCG9084210.1 LysR family transcriptional regulator [Laribacter hongkongensis]